MGYITYDNDKTWYAGLKHDIHIESITKTYLYKFDPLQPHFYIVKLGFTGVHIIFLILLNNIDCGDSLEPPRRGSSNEYPQSMFWADIWKISGFLSENFWVFGDEIFYIFEKACFRNGTHYVIILNIQTSYLLTLLI